MIGHINFDLKVLGERSAGNPHATFDVAGVGNGEMARTIWAQSRKRQKQTSSSLHFTAPILDPTRGQSEARASSDPIDHGERICR
jgi:hypothetical protein